MKRLSLHRGSSKKGHGDRQQQQKISSFFTANVFKTPEVANKREHNEGNDDKDMIESTPESESKKRKLFKLKKRSSKLGLLVASTTSLIAGKFNSVY